MPLATKAEKTIFSVVNNQGHKVIDHGVIWKDIISGVYQIWSFYP